MAATNQARAAAGLPGLSVSADLTAAATHQAQNMASSNALFHTPNLGSGLCCWVMVGENVGDGPCRILIGFNNGVYETIVGGAEDDGLTPEQRQRRRQGLARSSSGRGGSL